MVAWVISPYCDTNALIRSVKSKYQCSFFVWNIDKSGMGYGFGTKACISYTQLISLQPIEVNVLQALTMASRAPIYLCHRWVCLLATTSSILSHRCPLFQTADIEITIPHCSRRWIRFQRANSWFSKILAVHHYSCSHGGCWLTLVLEFLEIVTLNRVIVWWPTSSRLAVCWIVS